MASSLNTALFLFFCQLQSGSAAGRQIKEITPQPGDDVTLPCKAPYYVSIAAVQWIRFDLEKHVYLKSDGHLNTAYQDPSYENRVQLKDDEMKNGELSLILKNVNNNDEGTYECLYVDERIYDQIKLISIVYLKVKDPTVGNARDGKDTRRGYPGVPLPVTLMVSGLVGLVILKKLKGRSEKKPILPVDDPDVL